MVMENLVRQRTEEPSWILPITFNSPTVYKLHGLFVILKSFFPFLLFYIMHIYVVIESEFLQ